jgi:hypothetical protein
MERAIERYYRMSGSVEGWTDPEFMRQFAAGPALDILLKHRCEACPDVQVVKRVGFKNLQVLEYSETMTKVRYHVEVGWQRVDVKSRSPVDRCHAESYNDAAVLVRENGVWKITIGGGELISDPDLVGDTPELLARYCQSN